MTSSPSRIADAVVVEHDLRFSFVELCRVSHADAAFLQALVEEGVLRPEGHAPDQWMFAGEALGRARAAHRLRRDLALDAHATALVLQLLDEIHHLRTRLR